MIQVKHLTFAHVNVIFDDVSFTVGSGQKVGLAGPNGAGKSTLLKLLMGSFEPQRGSISIEGSIGYVPQEIKHDETLQQASSVREYIDRHQKNDDYALIDMMQHMELTLDLYQKPHHLSGGQKTKLAIIRALVDEPEILLLDEPTNFLDIAGKAWVMNFLAEYPKTLILISHDLKLLDAAIDKVLFVNPHTKKIEEYKGTYTHYLTVKEKQDAFTERKIINEQKHIKRMEESLKKLYKRTSDKGVRQRVMLQRRIERMKDKLPELPPDVSISFKLPVPAWVGELPIRAIDICKSYDDLTVLDNLNFSIKRGERVAFIGPNGAGKSTFIKILMGNIQPDSGEIIINTETKIGYYSQEFETFDFDKTLMETVKDKTNQEEKVIRPFLASFLFKGESVFQNVGSLSGGEKTRLSIAMLLLQDFNVLVLDEPTTYLDVMSQRIILEALKKYTGSMIIVSHTEEFIQELKPNRALFLPEHRIEFWTSELLDKVSEV